MLDLTKAREKFNRILKTQDAEAIRAWKIRNDQRKLEKDLRKAEVCESLSVLEAEKQDVNFSDPNLLDYGFAGESNYAMAA